MIKEYLLYLTENKMYSVNTIRRYNTVLVAFAKAMNGKRWSNIQRQDVESYLANLQVSEASKSSCLSAIRGIFTFVCSHYGLSDNPCRYIASPKSKSTIPHIVDIDTISKAIQCTSDKEIKLAILLMSRCGLRVSECLSIDVDTIENGRLLVIGKGKKERYIYLPSYVETLAHEVRQNGKLFTYSDRDFRYRIWQAFRNVGANVSPHMLRHTFATSMLNNGMQLPYLQSLLGHADIKTTQIYLHTDSKNVRSAYYSAIA